MTRSYYAPTAATRQQTRHLSPGGPASTEAYAVYPARA